MAARLMGLRTPCCCCRRSGCIIGFSVVVLGHRGGHHSRARVQCCVFVFVFVIVSRRRSTSMCFCTAPPDTGTKGSGLDLGPQCWYPVASPGCHSAINYSAVTVVLGSWCSGMWQLIVAFTDSGLPCKCEVLGCHLM